MTLLKFIRNQGLSYDEIRTVIQDSELPDTWSANQVSRFINRCPVDSLRESLQVLHKARQNHRVARCQLLGAHLEGPFIAEGFHGRL